ncbi:MAG: hypothetical protein J0H29_10515 [Sphingobacteriales bacterium]|nr:hypothetical protein [Sphingobacteriales bacterium]OJY86832.1 MAG: hypothetical protein BGP14_18530 [Sphingobacteriales bacterium 44-15]
MEIKKEDLVFNHYTWYDDNTDARKDMSPTRKTFDRNNGAHILWIANWYIAEYPGSQKADIAKLEALLSDRLPSGLMSEKSVCNWLINTRSPVIIPVGSNQPGKITLQ